MLVKCAMVVIVGVRGFVSLMGAKGYVFISLCSLLAGLFSYGWLSFDHLYISLLYAPG